MIIIDKHNYNIQHFHDAQQITQNIPFEQMKFEYAVNERLIHLKHSMEQVKIAGSVLEFGVYQGTTINEISSFFSEDTVHGFDSFEGLPENWITRNKERYKNRIKRPKGFFALDQLPEVNKNVKLWKGWFDQTIIKYKQEENPKQIKFLHVDGDLYSSAKVIFDNLSHCIIPGTIIVFDEFYPWSPNVYDTWADHEYLAFKEFVEKENRQFTIISRNNHQQTCVKIIK